MRGRIVSAAAVAGTVTVWLVEGGHDLLDEAFTHARRVHCGDREQFAAAGFAQSGRSAVA